MSALLSGMPRAVVAVAAATAAVAQACVQGDVCADTATTGAAAGAAVVASATTQSAAMQLLHASINRAVAHCYVLCTEQAVCTRA
jgi:hypothetical protein